jgi:hypothetical protein
MSHDVRPDVSSHVISTFVDGMYRRVYILLAPVLKDNSIRFVTGSRVCIPILPSSPLQHNCHTASLHQLQ